MAAKKKRATATATPERTIGSRLKELRIASGMTQESMGTQELVSTPGWIKIENGQRLPSDRLINQLVAWFVKAKSVRAGAKSALEEELLTLKYCEHRQSDFLRKLAKAHLDQVKAEE